MKKLLAIMTAMVGLGMIAIDADARRLGGGKSMGTQRGSVTQRQATPQQAPAQQQQQSPSATTTPAPAQQPSGAGKWLGPLAGLALGAGLASLFLHNGLAGALAGILLIMALVAAAMYVLRMLRGRPGPVQYAGAGAQGGIPPSVAQLPGDSAAPHSVAATAGRWPAGFDADQFTRHARLNFVNMQAAHDRKDLSAMRDFLTPELYRDIEADVQASGNAPQQTDVVTLNAEVLDVATEGSLHVVSVRFSGLIRETAGQEPQEFSEIWHLEKPVDGRSGWLVSGIQQG
ncbi:MAG TPA: Tim44-like domain-containing protein [Burkholderiales bacterium]|nr:Tim44-like domain-containing protein [Burkholderiales bacterium]